MTLNNRCCGSQIIGCYALTGEHSERPLEVGQGMQSRAHVLCGYIYVVNAVAIVICIVSVSVAINNTTVLTDWYTN